MGTVYRRGRKLWVGFKGPEGKWLYRSSGYVVGQEAQAERLVLELEEAIKRGDTVSREAAGTVAEYAATWFDRRSSLWNTPRDRKRWERHVTPALGAVRLDLVRPRHVRELVAALTAKLSPRTVINTYGLVRRLFADAVADELLTASPCQLQRGDLPQKADRDPAWRGRAVYSRAEVELLISDARVPLDRRVLYALAGLAGLRMGEINDLRWASLDASRAPLGVLHVTSSYTRVNKRAKVPKAGAREVPVHPVLADLLDGWWRAGFLEVLGRPPDLGGLILPSASSRAGHGGRRTDASVLPALRRDLEVLGLRHRRFHDLRRTFISLARGDGANRDALRTVTHNPRSGDVFDQYTTFDWASRCHAVASLNVRLPSAPQPGPLTAHYKTALQSEPPEMHPVDSALLFPVPKKGFEPSRTTALTGSAESIRAIESATEHHEGAGGATNCRSVVSTGVLTTAVLADELAYVTEVFLGRRHARERSQNHYLDRAWLARELSNLAALALPVRLVPTAETPWEEHELLREVGQ